MGTRTVLGLSLSSRMVSFALIENNILIHYHSSLHKGIYNDEKRDRMLKRLHSLLANYCITDIALALPYEIHTTPNITHLLESVMAHFKKQNIPVCTYYPDAFDYMYEEEERKTKKALMREVCNEYPELEWLYMKELRNKSKYYVKLFEAVALAMIHSKTNSKNRLSL